MKTICSILIGLSIVIIFGCIEIKSPPLKPEATSFTIDSIRVIPLTKYSDEYYTQVLILVSIQDGNFQKANFGSAHLVTRSGKEIDLNEFNSAIGNFTTQTELFKRDNQAYFSYRFPPISQIPKEIGSIYFKTDISFDDLPTQSINVLVIE
jgi:hypothetical protein